jgi:hypothetical protein
VRRFAATLLLSLTVSTAVPVPVAAQVAPPPIPELPEPIATVVAVLAPSVTPVCGTTAVLGFLGPSVLASAPPEVRAVLTELGPTLVVLCGAIPVDTGGYTCQLDGDLIALLAESIEAAAGSSIAAILLTALPSPVRALMNQVRNLTDLLPGGQPVEDLAAAVLQCVEPAADDTSVPPAEDGTSTTAVAVEVPAPDLGGVLYAAPLSDLLGPSARPVVVDTPAEPDLVTVPVTETTGFQYAGVLLVPLALLLGAVFVGGALTRELAPRRCANAEQEDDRA